MGSCRSPSSASAEQSRIAWNSFACILAEKFPDESLDSLTVSPDLEHSLSGNYVRGLLRRGSTYTAVLGVPSRESTEAIENSLTFALLWLDRRRHSNRRGTVTGLRIILPKGASGSVAHRVAALDPGLSIELYESDPFSETLERIAARAIWIPGLSLIVSTKLFSLDRDRPSILSSKSLRAPSAFILRRNHAKFGFVFGAWLLPAGRTAAFSSASRMPTKNSRLPLGQLSRICFATSKPTAIRLLATRAIRFTAHRRSAGSSHWFLRMSRE
jgi:hypothetical protein